VRVILASLIGLLVAGCATPLATQRASLAGKAVCCGSPSEFTYSPLASERKAVVEITEAAPAYAFPSGKSYFAAFKLESKRNRTLLVESEFNGVLIGQFFQPTCMFLDVNHRPLRTDSPAMDFVPSTLIPHSDAHMAGALKVPDNAEYVVIYTTGVSESTAKATIPGGVGVFIAGGRFPVVSPNSDATVSLSLSPTGTIALSLTNLPSRN
jgi:maltose operon periplasmic protein